MWNKEGLEQALKDSIINFDADYLFDAKQVIIDSRQKVDSAIFIAIDGENNDGHNYLTQAFANGCILAIVHKIPKDFIGDKRLILVKNSFDALISLACYARSRFAGKVIAVTGSNGKTSVKDMLKNILSVKHRVFANQGNFNNHFGLPLTLANLTIDCQYAILEMGMSNTGEIDFLSQIAKPDIAIITNVARAHIANFKDESEIALAKSEIFSGLVQDGFAVVNYDNKYYDLLRRRALDFAVKESNIISFGKGADANIKLNSCDLDGANMRVNVSIFGDEFSYLVNSVNQVVVLNSLMVISVLKSLGANITDYLQQFLNIAITKGRGNIIKINKFGKSLTIIDDSYNANSYSVRAGLKFLADLKEQNPNSRTVAMIGDMLELGDNSVAEHRLVAKSLQDYKIDKVLLVGNLTKNIVDMIDPDKLIGHFEQSKQVCDDVVQYLQENDIILVKGSRGIAMELIVDNLCQI